MAVKSVYSPRAHEEVIDGVLRVVGEEHHHLMVSRTRPGEEVEVFNGAGNVWPGVVVETGRDGTRIRLGVLREVAPGTTEIVLAPSLVRNAAFEWMLEKAVELGVSRIAPFRAERSNENGRGRERRWKRIVLEATKQSKQYYLPEIDGVRSFDDVLDLDAASRIVFAEAGRGSLRAALSGSPVLCIVGPEGGWTSSELDRMLARGIRQVHLGDRILRAETAAVLAVGLVAYELGAL